MDKLVYICIGTVILAELMVWLYLKHIKKEEGKKPLLDLSKVKGKASFRKLTLKLVMAHYMAYDASLGHRMKPNREPFRLLHRMPGLKRKSKKIKFKDFFEIRTDDHGFIVNREGQKRDYKAIVEDESTYRIIALGNSVTAGYGVPNGEDSWASQLESNLNKNPSVFGERYKSVVVINASSLGSQISQELRHFQDELIFLNPHLVLSFTGGIMDYNYTGNPVDLSFHDEQHRMNKAFNCPWYLRQKALFPNIVEILNQRFTESENTLYPYKKDGLPEVYAPDFLMNKVRQFRGVCDENGIDYLFFFQPGIGPGRKALSKEEENLKKYFERYFFDQDWNEYETITVKYEADVASRMDRDYQYNFMHVFEDVKETTYADPRHPNRLGHKIIAEKMEEIIKARLHSEYRVAA